MSHSSSTNNIAYIFPGQGSQYVGMGGELVEKYAEVRSIFDKAKEELANDYFDICLNGPEDTLNDTIYTQVCIYVLSYGVYTLLESRGFMPRTMAGHSLGEYTALTAAGVIPFEDGLNIVSKRARLMSSAARKNPGNMLAIIGADMRTVDDVVEQLSTKGIISIANYNCPGQVVVSVEASIADQAVKAIKSAGAKKIVPLPVSGAFHSEIMADAETDFVSFLNGYIFLTAGIPVIPNTLAKPTVNASKIREALESQISTSVKWQQSIQQMIGLGISTFIEVGPGQVLTRLVKRIDKNVQLLTTDKPAALEKTFKYLEKAQA